MQKGGNNCFGVGQFQFEDMFATAIMPPSLRCVRVTGEVRTTIGHECKRPYSGSVAERSKALV